MLVTVRDSELKVNRCRGRERQSVLEVGTQPAAPEPLESLTHALAGWKQWSPGQWNILQRHRELKGSYRPRTAGEQGPGKDGRDRPASWMKYFLYTHSFVHTFIHFSTYSTSILQETTESHVTFQAQGQTRSLLGWLLFWWWAAVLNKWS